MTAEGYGDWIGELARSHAQELVAFARREGLGGEDAIDSVQEAFGTFLKLSEARALADKPEEARALLAAVVRNAARNMRRRHHRALPHVELDNVAQLSADEPRADLILEAIEERVRLYGCIEELEDAQRHVVTLRMLEELSGAETAERLGLDPGHVAVLLHRAKKALHRCIVR